MLKLLVLLLLQDSINHTDTYTYRRTLQSVSLFGLKMR